MIFPLKEVYLVGGSRADCLGSIGVGAEPRDHLFISSIARVTLPQTIFSGNNSSVDTLPIELVDGSASIEAVLIAQEPVAFEAAGPIQELVVQWNGADETYNMRNFWYTGHVHLIASIGADSAVAIARWQGSSGLVSWWSGEGDLPFPMRNSFRRLYGNGSANITQNGAMQYINGFSRFSFGRKRDEGIIFEYATGISSAIHEQETFLYVPGHGKLTFKDVEVDAGMESKHANAARVRFHLLHQFSIHY